MEWTKENVLKTLKSNPDFSKIANEMEGKFNLCYTIGGNTVWLSNSIGGHAEVYLVFPINANTVKETSVFAEIAKNVLQELINQQ